MIVRILGEGQYRIPDDRVPAVQEVDKNLEKAVDAGDEAAFAEALGRLVATIRDLGEPLPVEELVPSDAVVPDADTTLAEAQSLLSDEGLIPD